MGTEKHQGFVRRAVTLEDDGCFAMTELSHGSNVQSVKTTATYDPATKEFVLRTPTQADMKFWIGNLGKTAQMAVVFAQLITKGKNQGVHAFVVPVRDRRTHLPLPGITIGDCGEKLGMAGVDNGFMIFNNYRVPKDALLDKISQVADDGTYTSSIAKKSKRFAFMMSTLCGGRFSVTRAAAVREP